MEITTARALEICLARVPMHPQAATVLVSALGREREKPSTSPVRDPDEITARLHLVLYHLSDADVSFPKTALVGRIRDARAELLAIVGVP